MIVEAVRICTDDVRNTCIKENWYTRGDNEAYNRMFKMCRNPYSVQLLYSIAKDIYEHSDKEYWEGYSDNDDECIMQVMWTIRNDCCISFFKEV